jgi:hypothetical protein
MAGNKHGWLVGLLVSVGLVWPTSSFAGGLFWHDDCPKPDYSPLHYWAPTLYRCRAYHHDPQYIYPPLLEPRITPGCHIQRFPCPPVPPAVSAADYPVPPIRPGPPATEPSPPTPAEPGAGSAETPAR